MCVVGERRGGGKEARVCDGVGRHHVRNIAWRRRGGGAQRKRVREEGAHVFGGVGRHHISNTAWQRRGGRGAEEEGERGKGAAVGLTVITSATLRGEEGGPRKRAGGVEQGSLESSSSNHQL